MLVLTLTPCGKSPPRFGAELFWIPYLPEPILSESSATTRPRSGQARYEPIRASFAAARLQTNLPDLPQNGFCTPDRHISSGKVFSSGAFSAVSVFIISAASRAPPV